MLLVLIVRVPTRWTRTVTLFPCTTRFRSLRAFLGSLLAEFANATGGREARLLRVEFLARRIAGDLHQLAALGQRGIGIGQDALLVATVLGAVVGIEMRDPRRQGDRAMSSDERRVGKDGVSTVRYSGWPY